MPLIQECNRRAPVGFHPENWFIYGALRRRPRPPLINYLRLVVFDVVELDMISIRKGTRYSELSAALGRAERLRFQRGLRSRALRSGLRKADDQRCLESGLASTQHQGTVLGDVSGTENQVRSTTPGIEPVGRPLSRRAANASSIGSGFEFGRPHLPALIGCQFPFVPCFIPPCKPARRSCVRASLPTCRR